MIAESINEPAIGDLNGDGKDDVVVATNETYGAEPPAPGDIAGGFGQGLSAILGSAAGGSSRVYAVNGASGSFLTGWPIKLNGAIQSTLPLIGPGRTRPWSRWAASSASSPRPRGRRRSRSTKSTARWRERPAGGLRRRLRRHRPQRHDQPLRVGFGRQAVARRRSRHRQVRPLAQRRRQPAAGRPERPLQPPDRRLRRADRRSAAGLPAGHRRLPVPLLLRHRQGRFELVDQPGGRRNRARAAARLRRGDRARRLRLPEGDRRLAVRAGGASPTTAGSPTSPARATCSSGTSRTCRPARPSGRRSATTSRGPATTTRTARPRTNRGSSR